MAANTVLYSDLSADNEGPMTLASMCPRCEETGETKIMMTMIPHYKELILMSFSCDHCGYRNCEVQSGGKVQEQGLKIVLNVKRKEDLDRQVVKSEYAAVAIPEIELEIPNFSRAGEITTIEGVLRRIEESLKVGQEERAINDPAQAEKIDNFLSKLNGLLTLQEPFTLIIDDPSGNSFIENPLPFQVDAEKTIIHYCRTLQQDKQLCLAADDATEAESNANGGDDEAEQTSVTTGEVMHFSETPCPSCSLPADTNMKLVDIPYFKQVVLMATTCDSCGYRTNEVKTSTGIADRGCRLTLSIEKPEDLTRDVLKSETCCLSIPTVELDVGWGAIAGRFTTVEGLLNAVRDQLKEDSFCWMGDSAEAPKRTTMATLLTTLDDIAALRRPGILQLDDCAGNSYIQNLLAPLSDPRLEVEFYERSPEQNEELGLTDMVVDNYQQPSDNTTEQS